MAVQHGQVDGSLAVLVGPVDKGAGVHERPDPVDVAGDRRLPQVALAGGL